MEIFFIDQEELCYFDGDKVKKFKSKYIEGYRQTAERIAKSRSWKESGEGARFRGDERWQGEDGIAASLTGVYGTSDNHIVYSFVIENTSGFYSIDLGDEKSPEAHIYSSVEEKFAGGMLDGRSGNIACSISRDFVSSDIAFIDTKTALVKTVTDGDTLDEDPYICPDDGNIVYFSSRGVGRGANGDFVAYSSASVMELNLDTLELRELFSSPKFSYIKPKACGDKLYAIRIPNKKKSTNPIIEILLIPVRILQALVNFVNIFVTAFTGKSLSSDGNNPTKGREMDSRKMYIHGQLIDAQREYKRNIKRDRDGGFVPLEWKLVELNSGEIIKSGVLDYDLAGDGNIVATNGKSIFLVAGGKTEKIVSCEKCTSLTLKHEVKKGDGLFEL